MVYKITIPQLDANITEGTIGRWLKKEGDIIKKGDPLFEFETYKVITDIKAEEDGILKRILVPEQSNVKVLDVVGLIAKDGEEFNSDIPSKREEVKITPRAKKIALEKGVDFKSLKGTGPEGRITEKDVLSNIQPDDARNKEMIFIPKLKKIGGARLLESLQRKPHSYVKTGLDLTKVNDSIDSLTKKCGTIITFNDVIVSIVAKALRKYKLFNSDSDGDHIFLYKEVNIGVAVNIKEGIIVPVIKNADKKTLADISKEIKILLRKAMVNQLTLAEITNCTFTITNLGQYDVTDFFPIINENQNAILGISAITDKPIAKEGKIQIKPIANLILTFNHNVINGAEAAEFLACIKKELENFSYN